MSTTTISHANCSSVQHRPALDVLVEKLARRMLSWSERPHSVRERSIRRIDRNRFAELASERVIASVRPVRWF